MARPVGERFVFPERSPFHAVQRCIHRWRSGGHVTQSRRDKRHVLRPVARRRPGVEPATSWYAARSAGGGASGQRHDDPGTIASRTPTPVRGGRSRCGRRPNLDICRRRRSAPVGSGQDVEAMAMETRKIGSLKVSVVGLGTNNFGFRMDEAEVPAVVDAALEAGINLFDTADSYRTARSSPGAGPRRTTSSWPTKFGSPTGRRPGGARPSTSARRGTQPAQPAPTASTCTSCTVPTPTRRSPTRWAPSTSWCRRARSARSGARTSRRSAGGGRRAVTDGAARFVSVQNHYSLLHRDDEADVLPGCERHGVAYIPYFPLASGVLPGSTAGGSSPQRHSVGRRGRHGQACSTPNFDPVERLTAWADARGHRLLELAFAWLAAKPAVASVIAGATRGRPGWGERRRGLAALGRGGRRDGRDDGCAVTPPPT